MAPQDTTCYPLFALTCALTLGALYLSARRGALGTLGFLALPICTLWIGTTVAPDLAHCAWQRMPSPLLDEALADAEPAGMLPLGSIPSSVACVLGHVLPKAARRPPGPCAPAVEQDEPDADRA